MRARFYVSSVGRFIQPDTIVPDVTNPGDLNRYAYVRNSPLILVDPSGHGPDNGPLFPMIDGICSNGAYCPGANVQLRDPNAQALINAEPAIGIQVVHMPTNRPQVELSEVAQRTAFVFDEYGAGADVVELMGLLTPVLQEEDLFALEDLFVTAIDDIFSQDTYVGNPIPDGPRMLVIGQDTLITAADTVIGLLASGTRGLPEAAATALLGRAAGIAVGHAWEMSIDGASTVASLAYDWSSMAGAIPTFVNLGVYFEGAQLNIVILVYPVN